jgi:hypothetical protein
MFKKPASGVLGIFSCSRTVVRSARKKKPAALLDKLFEHPAFQLKF